MMGSLRTQVQSDLLSFGEGLLDMIHDPESDSALATASILAETIHMHHLWLKSKFEKK